MDEDEEFKKTSSFRVLRDEIAAVMLLFEKAAEWADLVTCLQRLNKARCVSGGAF